MAIADPRIVYGARCTWWDSIDKVGTLPTLATGRGLPCCPHCRGVLYEVADEATWFAGVDRYEADGHPGYRAMVEWARGKCFSGWEVAQSAFAATQVQ